MLFHMLCLPGQQSSRAAVYFYIISGQVGTLWKYQMEMFLACPCKIGSTSQGVCHFYKKTMNFYVKHLKVIGINHGLFSQICRSLLQSKPNWKRTSETTSVRRVWQLGSWCRSWPSTSLPCVASNSWMKMAPSRTRKTKTDPRITTTSQTPLMKNSAGNWPLTLPVSSVQLII